MREMLQRLLHRKTKSSASKAVKVARQSLETTLHLENEVQSLQIQQQEDKRVIENLVEENDRIKARLGQLVNAQYEQMIEELFNDLASPASQIITQSYLHESQGKPMLARDVLLVARRMVRVLERHGLVIDGNVGERTTFDPEKHVPLQHGQTMIKGEAVIIRFCGISSKQKRLYKAIVERENSCQED